MAKSWAPRQLALVPDQAAADVARRGRPRPGAEADPRVSPARVRRRGALAADRARPRRRRQRVPAAGRRLRRELRGLLRQQHQGEAARHPADGDRAHLLARRAGREGRPHRRPVRQAALVATTSGSATRICRRSAATSSTTSPPPRPRACPPRPARTGVPPVGVDAEPAAGVHEGRLRRPRPGPRLDPGVRRVEPGRPAVRPAGIRDRPCPAFHAGHAAWTPSRTTPSARSTCGPATRR